MNARIHARTHTDSTRTHARTRIHTHTNTHTHTHTHTHTNTHTHTPVAYEGNQGNETEEKIFLKRKVFKDVMLKWVKTMHGCVNRSRDYFNLC